LQAHGLAAGRFHVLDLSSTAAVEHVLRRHAVGAVIHFAANAFASESVAKPLLYFHNVTQNTLSVLEAMANAGVTRLIYSSSCATYGEPGPEDVPVKETAPQRPISPYGVSKKLAEEIILSTAASYKLTGGARLDAALLRYFNVIGADPAARVGPVPRPEHHAWARVADACLDTAEGRRPRMEINGVDYLTPDGSVIRDFVHVRDLAGAHLAVLQALQALPASPQPQPLVYNVGTGVGNSVRELAKACQLATGVQFPVVEHSRRPGDPPYIVGDARKIYAELGWRSQYNNLTESLEHMWRWRNKLALLYAAPSSKGSGRGRGGKKHGARVFS